MNKQKKIEWTDFTWNPITGCTNACPYCYAKRQYLLHQKPWEKQPHTAIDKNLNKPFDPKFWEYKLKDKICKKPSKIFVGSMAGMFESKIPNEYIEMI